MIPSRLFRFVRDTRLGAALVATAVVLAFSALPIYLALAYNDAHRQALAGEVERHVDSRMRHAQALLERARTIPGIVALTIAQAGSPERFESGIRNILGMSGIIESVNIASTHGPATVIHRHPADQAEAVTVHFGPALARVMDKNAVVSLSDGSLLIRQALAQTDAGGAEQFWGYLTAVASISDLIQELQLLALVNEGFGVHFGVQWDSGAAPSVIFSGGDLAVAGAVRDIPLAGNARLRLMVKPPQVSFVGKHPLAVPGLALVDLLLFLLTFELLRRPQLLEREVEQRTEQIAAEKVALKKEIAARLAAESYLERSHAVLDSIFEHIPGMIVLKRVSDFRIARINSCGEQMLGRSRDLLCGRCNEEIFAPELADLLTQADIQALAQDGSLQLPLQRVEMPAVAPRWISFRKTVLRDRNGVPQYILEFGEDLTERENLDRRLQEQLHFLEQLIEAIPGPVFSKDVAGRYIAVNGPFEQFVGQPRAALIGKTVLETAPQSLARELHELDRADRDLLMAGGKQIYEAQMTGADGGIVETMIHKAVFHAGDGSRAGIVGIALDISARKNAERRAVSLNRILMVLSEINHRIIHTRDRARLLEEARKILQERGGFAAVWIQVTQGDSQIIADEAMRQYAARVCREIENPARRCWPERRLHCQALDCCNAGLAAELHQLGLQSLIHLPLQCGDVDWGAIGIFGAVGQSFSAEERALLDELAGNLAFALEAMRQEELRRKVEDRLDFLAHYDALTALPNRDHFNRRLAQALGEAQDHAKRVAVVAFDLDRFKLINETMGHVAGDQLLVEVSSRLVGEAKCKLDVARLGGDQFAILIPGLDSVAQATQAVVRIQEGLCSPFLHFLDKEIHVSASIGVSLFPEDGDDAETLSRNADSAMYRAIEDGGNTYRFFRQEMNERAAARIALESGLHHALERREFSVHFQPLVAAGSGRIAGAEALLRWNCPAVGGNVSPETFIPLLEETGLIRPVGEWVLRQACAAVKRWQALGHTQMFVAVNMSALQLTADLPQLVAAAVADHGILPGQLELELTESTIMRDAEHGIRMLHQLKALGIRLSIDDFGTGYSSLAYLKRLTLSTLKIDRSFVRDIPDDDEAVSIARAILALGHSLHLDIIGEGAETREQVEFLCHNGCDLLQGYYFAMPLGAGEFIHLLGETATFALPANSQRTLQLLTGKRLHG